MLKNRLAVCMLLCLPLGGLAASQNPPIPDLTRLQGTAKDACSVLLCLSSLLGRSLSECQAPLRRYFSITARDFSKTLRHRKNFLNQCPLGDMSGKENFVESVNNGAGRCDATTLNRTLQQATTFERCTPRGCTTIKKYRVGNQLPGYCQAYLSNGYADFTLHYSGQPTWQSGEDFNQKSTGLWVD